MPEFIFLKVSIIYFLSRLGEKTVLWSNNLEGMAGQCGMCAAFIQMVSSTQRWPNGDRRGWHQASTMSEHTDPTGDSLQGSGTGMGCTCPQLPPGVPESLGKAASLALGHHPRGRVCTRVVYYANVHVCTHVYFCVYVHSRVHVCACMCAPVDSCVHIWGFCLYCVMTPARSKNFNHRQLDLHHKRHRIS